MSQKIENGKLIINVSDNKENYSQKNNQFIHEIMWNGKTVADVKASTMCNVTSICMALDYNGWVFPDLGKWKQPEDALGDFIMKSAEVDEYYKTKMPALYKDYATKKCHEKDGKVIVDYYTPNEVHAVLAYGVNKWLGCEVDTFKENADIFDILKELINGKACVISGVFNGLHHIVTLVGAEWLLNGYSGNVYGAINSIAEAKKMPQTIIIDDPYGDFRQGYKTGFSGNDIKIPFNDFIKMIKPVGNAKIKMCHFIKSGAAVV